MSTPRASHWLLLIHQIPPKPAYLRVKIGRRLARVGAVALKATVYALPCTDPAIEDFQWVRSEVVAGGGDATIVEARLVEGLTDAEVEGLFRAARETEYDEIANEARALAKLLDVEKASDTPRHSLEGEVVRLERHIGEIAALDFFGAPGRETASGLVAALRKRLRPEDAPVLDASLPAQSYRGRTWVTRAGVYVDRIASAWLIRRFIDPEATFRFVPSKGYEHQAGELRFDMFEGEFTHEGDCCSFEVLCRRLGLADAALRPIAEIIHDIDLKDDKYQREEAAGIERLLAGVCMGTRDDEERLRRGTDLFNDLYEYFRKNPGKEESSPAPVPGRPE